jgi:hypothetical protein
MGAIVAVLYYLFISYAWKSANVTVLGRTIFAVVGFVFFAAVTYATDHFRYQRYLRKKNASPR